MGCRFCVHWAFSVSGCSRWDRAQPDLLVGECRRFPKTEQTNAAHQCGEFVCLPDPFNGTDLMESQWQNRSDGWDNYLKERVKRIAAEKKASVLRKKIKTLSSERKTQ